MCLWIRIPIVVYFQGSLQAEGKQAVLRQVEVRKARLYVPSCLEEEAVWEYPRYNERVVGKMKATCFLLSTFLLSAEARAMLVQLWLCYHNRFGCFLSAMVRREEAKASPELSQAHGQHNLSCLLLQPTPSLGRFAKPQN